jgi:nucleoid DNA-binding protein
VKSKEIARTLARQKHLPQAAAQDQIDELVHKILKRLKQGKPVELPGLGKLIPRKSR